MDLVLPEANLFEPRHEVEDVPFDELIHQLAGSIADAQVKLDKSTADVMKTLAETPVEMPTKMERRITEDGAVRAGETQFEERSLLELGLAPTRYQFSEANLEVSFDLHITEKETSDTEKDGKAKETLEMRAGTYNATEQRKYNREMSTNATMNATLEPVPLPAGMSVTDDIQQSETDGSSNSNGGNSESNGGPESESNGGPESESNSDGRTTTDSTDSTETESDAESDSDGGSNPSET